MTILNQTTFDDINFPTVRASGIHWEHLVDGLADSVIGQAGDRILAYGNGATNPGGKGDQILTAANHDAGGGGKGFRHWVGDGINNNGGSMRVEWDNVPSSDTYIRFYVRFTSGFNWASGISMKMLYVNQAQTNGFYFGFHSGVVGGSNGGTSWDSTFAWSDVMGGSTGDGLWHCFEIHVKMETSNGAGDGVFQMWVDGVQRYNNTTTAFGADSTAQWNSTVIGENAGDVANGQDTPVDFDDIVIADAYIGPLSGGGGQTIIHSHGLAIGY